MTIRIVNSVAGLLEALKTVQSGDTILLAPGTYAPFTVRNAKFAGTVTISSADPNDPAILTGMDVYTSKNLTFSKLAFSIGGSILKNPFLVTGSSNIAFTELNVYGSPNKPATVQTNNGLSFESDSNISVTNSQLRLFDNGVTEQNSTGVIVSGNRFYDYSGDAVDNGGSTNVVVSDNTIYDDYTPVDGQHPDGIQFWTNTETPAGSNIRVTGNVIYRGAGDLFQGVFMRRGTGGDAFSNVTIDNNTLFGLLYNGVYVQGADGVDIANNTITGFSDYMSRLVLEQTSKVSVTDNKANNFIYVDVTGLTQNGDIRVAQVPVSASSPSTAASATSSTTAAPSSAAVRVSARRATLAAISSAAAIPSTATGGVKTYGKTSLIGSFIEFLSGLTSPAASPSQVNEGLYDAASMSPRLSSPTP